MYGAILGFFIVLAALGIWRLLGHTRLRLGWRILWAVLATVLAAMLLLWGSICVSILLFQLSDPISW